MDFRLEVKKFVSQVNGDPTELLAVLHLIQNRWRMISHEIISIVAEEMDLPVIQVEGAATFYHFFSSSHSGKYTVYVNTSATAEISGCQEVIQAFEAELNTPFGKNSEGDLVGLRTTSCIGMCDQEPAILINGTVFPCMTADRVKELVQGMKAGLDVSRMERANHVESHIRLKGPVFFSEYTSGEGIRQALGRDSLDIIEEVKLSGLKGRGGAGFPTGVKWAACRASEAETRYLICNCDEGEPGTFKDRVLLTERTELIFEGMIIAGYAIEAREGILYLRGEYSYLRPHLENVLREMRSRSLLGRRILGSRFSFDIRIKLGAGAYICGEESALIESAEGKRGQPRNRPPFPVTSGYLRRPTVVNNPETLGSAVKIVLNGGEWFKKMGTASSSGVKLLSISGDCEFPGVYEIEWGRTVREVLALCGAVDTQAVQVGGPSGVCISEKDFDRKICYSDLPTGGAFTIFGKERDLLSVVQNYMEFFKDESCGFCVPCRAGNSLLVKELKKLRSGGARIEDLEAIRELGIMVKTASRCGLGQTSPNPILSTLENFRESYLDLVSQKGG